MIGHFSSIFYRTKKPVRTAESRNTSFFGWGLEEPILKRHFNRSFVGNWGYEDMSHTGQWLKWFSKGVLRTPWHSHKVPTTHTSYLPYGPLNPTSGIFSLQRCLCFCMYALKPVLKFIKQICGEKWSTHKSLRRALFIQSSHQMRQFVAKFLPNQKSWEMYPSIISHIIPTSTHGWCLHRLIQKGFLMVTLYPGMYCDPPILTTTLPKPCNTTHLHENHGLMCLHSCCFSITYAKKGCNLPKCLPTILRIYVQTMYKD